MPDQILQFNKQETNLFIANGDLFKAIYGAPTEEYLVNQLEDIYMSVTTHLNEYPNSPYYGTLDGTTVIEITNEAKRPRFTEF